MPLFLDRGRTITPLAPFQRDTEIPVKTYMPNVNSFLNYITSDIAYRDHLFAIARGFRKLFFQTFRKVSFNRAILRTRLR